MSLSQHNNKRSKKSAADDLTCPITLELPSDPVTAGDGKQYERYAIEAHISYHQNSVLKSPLTNEPMDRRLIPAPHIKSLIETLIDNGTITGDLADSWKEKGERKKEVEKLIRKAEAGETEAMYKVGCMYRNGDNEFVKRNQTLGFEWTKKAASARHVKAMAEVGDDLLGGIGTEKNISQGLMFTTSAAEQGSNLAAFQLGMLNSRGLHGLPVNITQAKYWLKKCLDTRSLHKHMLGNAKRTAEQELQKLEEYGGGNPFGGDDMSSTV